MKVDNKKGKHFRKRKSVYVSRHGIMSRSDPFKEQGVQYDIWQRWKE